MPGIVGFVRTSERFNRSCLQQCAAALSYREDYHQEELWADKNLAATRVHTGVLRHPPQPYSKGSLHFWWEGMVYSSNHLTTDPVSFPGQVLEKYALGELAPFLKTVNGCFAAALYDAEKQTLLLWTDRLGLKALYYYFVPGKQFSWSSEVKTFLQLPDFRKNFDVRIFKAFWELGYVPGDHTWFQDVHRVPAASLLSFDLSTGEPPQTIRYWSWESIQKIKPSKKAASVRLYELFQQAISRRLPEEGRLGVGLSGGLDSRAITAAASAVRPLRLFTFSKESSWELTIAKRVAKVAGAPLDTFLLDQNNWLDGRWAGVWKADGFKNFLHLHFSGQQAAIREICSVNLNGLLGGLAMGGIYAGTTWSGRINEEKARRLLGDYVDLNPPEQPFFDFPGADPFIIDNHIRRFSMAGSEEWATNTTQLYPFTDKDLLEFLYQLPDSWRVNSALFNEMLLRFFPEYFRTIPWQRTGVPIRKKQLTKWIIRSKFRQIQSRLGLLPNYSFTDYPNWLGQAEFLQFAENFLLPRQAIYPDFLEFGASPQQILQQADGTERLGRLLTIEYWLRRCYQQAIP